MRTNGTAVVTGASSPIGSAIALELARSGRSVVLHGFRNVESLETLKLEVESLGVTAWSYLANFADERQLHAFSEYVTECCGGSPDSLIIASSSGVMRPIESVTRKHLDWTFSVTSFPVLELSIRLKAASIVIVSSLGARLVVPSYSVLGAAKSAAESMVRYLAVELAPMCRVNAVSAGLVKTASAERLQGYEHLVEKTLESSPVSRLVVPQDIAMVTKWLCSADAYMVTGNTIYVDGGERLLY